MFEDGDVVKIVGGAFDIFVDEGEELIEKVFSFVD